MTQELPMQNSVSNVENIRATLRRAIDPALPVALIDYPDHPNVGDSAIWAGETKFLRDGKYDLRYVCDHGYFNEAALRHLMPRGQILLHGGGNFGTVWPNYQTFREKLATRMPDYRIVQLPQSLHFEDDESIQRSKDALSRHPDFLLLTRDRESLQFAQQQLGLRAEMCPDSALLLQGVLVRSHPTVDVLVLARTDKESKDGGLASFQLDDRSCIVTDWLDEPDTRTRMLTQEVKKRNRGRFGKRFVFQALQKHLFQSLADQRIERGVRQLSQGRIVVTDRLHAHILSLLLGIPHVVVDNSYGKLGRFISCWTADNPLVKVVNSADEAVVAARHLLQQ